MHFFDDERRNYKRVPMRLVAYVRRGPTTRAVTKDVSLGGVFIETHIDYKPQETIEFDLLIPREGGQEPLRVAVLGVVRWLQSANPKGVGVEIRSMSVNDRASFEAFVKRMG